MAIKLNHNKTKNNSMGKLLNSNYQKTYKPVDPEKLARVNNRAMRRMLKKGGEHA